tara:strand:+ start:31 stop:465 length:435 start_codon:yes stop_codon:yes gene_type:complete
MACETEDTIIEGTEYVCTQFPAIQSMKFKLKVLKVLGPVISEIIPMLGKKDNGDQLTSISGAIEKLFNVSSPDEIIDLMVEMLTTGNTKRDGQRLTVSLFEQTYSGDTMLEAYKAFAFVLKVNYKGFFKGQKGKELLAKVEAQV